METVSIGQAIGQQESEKRGNERTQDFISTGAKIILCSFFIALLALHVSCALCAVVIRCPECWLSSTMTPPRTHPRMEGYTLPPLCIYKCGLSFPLKFFSFFHTAISPYVLLSPS